MAATFTVSGGVWEFIPDGTVPDPYLGALSAVTGRFVANVSPAATVWPSIIAFEIATTRNRIQKPLVGSR